MVSMILNIVIVSLMILLVFILAGCASVVLFIIIDIIGEKIRGWRR